MKQLRTSLYIFFTASLLLILSACNKDKGNYNYNMPEEPIITNLDSVYHVFVGDSLIIAPTITMKSKAKLVLTWVISVPDPHFTDILDTGVRFHKIFGLGPSNYAGQLTVSNLDNGMKYFHTFIVSGQTAFVKGTTVLSLENGVTQLSFIKPNDSLQARVYEAVNPGEQLPLEPSQLFALRTASYLPPIRTYWVIGKSAANPGIQIDANTFRKKNTLADNFFDPPATIEPSKMFVSPAGVISGIINGKFYDGTTSTWNEGPTYGMFGLAVVGDYNLSPEMVLNYTGDQGPGNYIGFDKDKHQFVRFNLYGGAIYFGPAYTVTPGTAFNPYNIGMDLLHLQQINGGLCYAFCTGEGLPMHELKFEAIFDGPFEFNAIQDRVFAKPELILADTKWAATPNEIIYFTSNDKIYRYNPTNLDFKVLDAGFNGKKITMLKVLDDGTMVAGVDGSLFYLDISTGKNGAIIKTINGIPGIPVDIVVREL